MTQQEQTFPAGKRVPCQYKSERVPRTEMCFGAELRALAKSLAPLDADLLLAAADRLEGLLEETDRLSLLMSDVGAGLRGAAVSTASCLQLLTDVGLTTGVSEREAI